MQYSNKKLSQFIRAMLKASLAFTLLFVLLLRTADASLVVIGNKDIQASSLTPSQLSAIYLDKAVSLPTRETLVPVDQGADSAMYRAFYQTVLNMSPSDVNTYWSGLVFSGTGNQPVQVADDIAAIAAVENNSKTIAYVDSASIGDQITNVKVLLGHVSGEANNSNTASTQNTGFVASTSVNSAAQAKMQQRMAQEMASLRAQEARYSSLNKQRAAQAQTQSAAPVAPQPKAQIAPSNSPQDGAVTHLTADSLLNGDHTQASVSQDNQESSDATPADTFGSAPAPAVTPVTAPVPPTQAPSKGTNLKSLMNKLYN